MRTTKLGVFALAMLVSSAGQTQASQIFDFSITNTTGNVLGTVTGEIVLPFNGNGQSDFASEVLIETYPSRFAAPLSSVPLNVTDWPFQGGEDFAVQNGQLYYAVFEAVDRTDSSAYFFEILSYAPSELESTLPNLQLVGPATFSAHPTPEPATLTLLGTGLIAIGGFSRWRKGRSA